MRCYYANLKNMHASCVNKKKNPKKDTIKN